jgi:hypothetical protein
VRNQGSQVCDSIPSDDAIQRCMPPLLESICSALFLGVLLAQGHTASGLALIGILCA